MEGLTLKATATVRITKLNERGEVVGTEELKADLTQKEAEALWPLRKQD